MPTKEIVKEWHVAAFDETMKEKLVPLIGSEVALPHPCQEQRAQDAASAG